MQLRKLIDHLRWADARILEALRTASEPSAAALELYRHILGAEHVWLARLHGEPAQYAVWPELTIEECASLAEENFERLADYVERFGGDLQRGIVYRNSAGHSFESSIEDILLHVAMHGQYHRGQINSLLRQQKEMPAAVDYIAWVRGAAAATRQG